MALDNIDGKQLFAMCKDMFGTDRPTAEQLGYVMDMLKPSSYLLRNHTIKGNPMTFYVSDRNKAKALAHRPWQVGIINDSHRNLAVIKSRQLGISEIGVGKLLHFVDTHNYDRVKALYAFPTGKQMQDFVQTRLNPVLEKGYYATITDEKLNSVKAKRIRESYMYFRSSSTPGAMEGVDIDFLSLDEYDRVPTLAEASALESMSSSKYKITNRWSTPSVFNMGIHKLFEQSDQSWYLHKCDRCNYYNQMSYDEYDSSSIEAGGNIMTVNPDGVDLLAKTVVEGSFQFVCKKCGKPLDRWYNGSWVKKYPNRTQHGDGISGFMISQLNAVWISADQLKEKELNAKSKQAFYNYVIGSPYEDLGLTVTDEDVFNNTSEHINPVPRRTDEYRFICAGIDWGNFHWISIMGMRKDGTFELIKLANVQKSAATDMQNIGADLEAIKVILDPYDVDMIVADIGDSGDKIARLMQYYGADKVFGCRYPSTPKSTGQLNPTWSETSNTVKVDKLMQNKRYIAMLKAGQIRHYRNQEDPELKRYLAHWKNVVIRTEEDESTGDFYEVIGRRDDDHYSQASIYAILGLDRLRELFYSDGNYALNTAFIDTLYNVPGLSKPDIYSQY